MRKLLWLGCVLSAWPMSVEAQNWIPAPPQNWKPAPSPPEPAPPPPVITSATRTPAPPPPVIVSEFRVSAKKRLSEMNLVSGTDAASLQGLKAEPQFTGELLTIDGDVHVSATPVERRQAVLSFPVRFVETVTLDGGMDLKRFQVDGDTVFYKARYRKEPYVVTGRLNEADAWCGIARMKHLRWDQAMVCLSHTLEGYLEVRQAAYQVGTPGSTNSFLAQGFEPQTFIDYNDKVPFPKMKPSDKKTDMRLELVFFGADEQNAKFHWRVSNTVGDKTQSVYLDGLAFFSEIRVPYVEGHYVYALGRTLLVFDYDSSNKRLSYAGYVDYSKE
ncbi:MAG TPA: hypothetical protein VG839_04195 [Asticcacaulis sp.]|nr:hypothetical protein [Asticcacaulis sp.]